MHRSSRARAVAAALAASLSTLAALHPRALPAQTAPAAPAARDAVRDVARDAARGVARAAREREARRVTDRYDPHFRKYAKRYFGVATDWRWFKAQGMAESDLVPTARSRVGARGIMQLMPGTFALIRKARPEYRRIEDPEWNIAAGVMHDRYLWGLWERDVHPDDRWRFTFASYNAGEGTIARARAVARAARLDATTWGQIEQVAPAVPRWRWSETVGYVRRIHENHEALQGVR